MALGTLLPFWPALLFAYLEPISLIMGWNAAWNHPQSFVTKQVPTTPPTLTPISSASACLSYTVGNLFFVLAAVAILCLVISRETRVAKYYLIFFALGDLGHMYSSYKAMPPGMFWDFGNYNDAMIGNIGISIFLHVNRWATLLGVFGRLGPRA
ncbi:hypothetical protein K469DRAFT_732381 [Zopfia rhizophila CBS 207.26]|uniref:DUF7704 domain-containing protein n=1 Tax=Zopfia rhizophila CBS 207.26 TaxID=1314779 RepID=A0A6A6DET3_9PEZI|nr:hypothetical protein K469DRAFT_732381 [Zopfia rhizophila CBS 207.26]